MLLSNKHYPQIINFNKIWICCCCLIAKLCLTLCDPMDCSPPGSFVHGISQARILEWVAISYCRGSSWPKNWTHVSCIGKRILYHWATREAHEFPSPHFKHSKRTQQFCTRIPSLWYEKLLLTSITWEYFRFKMLLVYILWSYKTKYDLYENAPFRIKYQVQYSIFG